MSTSVRTTRKNSHPATQRPPHRRLSPKATRELGTSLAVGNKVRREKALDFSGCNSRPGVTRRKPSQISIGRLEPISQIAEPRKPRSAAQIRFGGRDTRRRTQSDQIEITPAGKETVLHNFADSGDGTNPVNALVLGSDGNFYGTTDSNPETIYEISSAGQLTILHTLTNAEGYQGGQMIQASDGDFYGGLNLGGANGFGTAFKMTPQGAFTVLHNFDGTDGTDAASGMVQVGSNSFIGAAQLGGTNNAGVIYSLTSSGTFSVLHNMDGPTEGSLVGVPTTATDGNLYGVTVNGGSANCGTIFEVTPTGVFSVLHTLDNTHGCNPEGYLTQGTDGKLYGLANGGGANGNGVFFSVLTWA
jgi:uncharacterized repeat protein (TIGR03803 family)